MWAMAIASAGNSKETMMTFMSFSSHFRFLLVLDDKVTKMFIYIFKSLVCLALQTETIVKKITQPKLPKTKNELTKNFNEPGLNLTFSQFLMSKI